MKGSVTAKHCYYNGHHLYSWGPHFYHSFLYRRNSFPFMLKGEELCKHVHQQTFLMLAV